MTLVYLGIGSNQQPETHIARGLDVLNERYQVVSVSPWYRSPALGFEGPDFINLVVAIETGLELAELALQLKQIERDFGRAPNAAKYSSRALDIDILLFGELSGDHHGLSLPRDDVWRFAFVLQPLLDIAPNLVCPRSQQPIANYWPKVAHQPLTRIPAAPRGSSSCEAG